MTNLSSSNIEENNQRSLQALSRAIALSQGEFSLHLLCSNSPSLQQPLVNHLQDLSAVRIQQIVLHPSVNTLFSTLVAAVDQQPLQALIVLGLESAINLDQLLVSTNMMRDEFRKQFPFPVVLWVNDEILRKLIRLAPDFKSLALNTVRVDTSNFKQGALLSA